MGTSLIEKDHLQKIKIVANIILNVGKLNYFHLFLETRSGFLLLLLLLNIILNKALPTVVQEKEIEIMHVWKILVIHQLITDSVGFIKCKDI